MMLGKVKQSKKRSRHGTEMTDTDHKKTSLRKFMSRLRNYKKDDVASVEESSDGDDGGGCESCGADYSFKKSLTTDLDESVLSDSSGLVTETTSSDSVSSDSPENNSSFLMFRLSYLIVTLVIMLADGLQGTHLYVLYEGYGFSVASLYCLGFITGAVTAPITGPMIDKFGRKKAALLYCFLEIWINMLEQFPFLSGLIISRMVGGITTNLLSTVFEAWVDTEYRRRGFDEAKYENLMRDSVVISNLAAIASGYLAHVLAERLGPVGPFEGAVTCTALAFAVVLLLWTENYGSSDKTTSNKDGEGSNGKLRETISIIKSDSRILRICITQGFTTGSLQIFIFLWSPILKEFSTGTEKGAIGLDSNGEPAYGLIFGCFMMAGVIGGLCSPFCRKLVTLLLSPLSKKSTIPDTVTVDGEKVRPMDVEFQGALCYFLCSLLLLVPCLLSVSDASSFHLTLLAFITYEIVVGLYSPTEGVIRSLYIPPESRASMMTVPRFIVNVSVAAGVISTELVSHKNALIVISTLMAVSGVLQLSLVSKKEWRSLFARVDHVRRKSLQPLRSLSMKNLNVSEISPVRTFRRCISLNTVENANQLDPAYFSEDIKPKRKLD